LLRTATDRTGTPPAVDNYHILRYLSKPLYIRHS
jgi:hypothetical protein